MHRKDLDAPTQCNQCIRQPQGSLETLSQREVQQLSEAGSGSLYTLFRQCALAILNTGAHVDNAKTILEAYKDFEVRIHQQDRGVRLELLNAPADAFVDGEMIASTREMLFSALRDIVYTESELASQRIDLESSQGITDYVFHLLRNARTLRPGVEPKMVVCWAATRSAARNTSTPRRSATSWACASWISAPAAARA